MFYFSKKSAYQRIKSISQNLFTSQVIREEDLNHDLFPKFSFSGAKFVYSRMQKLSDFEQKNKFERLKLFFLSPFGSLGVFFLLLIILCGLFIPFTTMSPYETRPTKSFLDFGVEGHILGTDKLGRDIWART